MFRTLYARLAGALLILLGLVGLLYGSLTVWSTRLYLQEANQRLHRDLAKGVVSEGLIGEEGRVGQAELKTVFHTLMVVNPAIEVYLLDPDGRLLAFSAPPGKVRIERVPLAPVLRFLHEPDRVPILGEDPRHPGSPKVFSAARIEARGVLRGYLYVILAGEPFESALEMFRRSHITRLSVGLASAGLLIVFGAGIAFFGGLTRRLRRLAAAVRAFHGSDRAAERGRGDEIRDLEDAFRDMQDRIRLHLAELAAADEERRRLITNVSHDLRTPLSSLQGHVETLLVKEAELGPEERRRHLEVALRSAGRLSRLVAGLFELAKLEAPETLLAPEPFALDELVQDVAQKLSPALDSKSLRAAVRTQAGAAFVQADIGLVERLVENLVRNAIRHSPQGGTVTAGFRLAGEWVETTVTDEGEGIAAEDLPHLFERFYRSRRTASDPDGAGLGLAIAKRIVELHGGEIRGENRAQGGAAFTFTLPAALAAGRVSL